MPRDAMDVDPSEQMDKRCDAIHEDPCPQTPSNHCNFNKWCLGDDDFRGECYDDDECCDDDEQDVLDLCAWVWE